MSSPNPGDAGLLRPLKFPGAWRFALAAHRDARGSFRVWYQDAAFRSATGHGLRLAQANCSVSNSGALRGIKYAAEPSGQVKYVTCLAGAVLDVVVDLKVGSPTFGDWHMERLDEANPATLCLPEGLGHAVMALADGSVVAYLLTAAHDAGSERSVHPLDPDIGITWPPGVDVTLSGQDSSAPGLHEARRAGLLPDYDACTERAQPHLHGDQ
jgi:dTDP-4-dehydrorhamnose 3,5-epimerase